MTVGPYENSKKMIVFSPSFYWLLLVFFFLFDFLVPLFFALSLLRTGVTFCQCGFPARDCMAIENEKALTPQRGLA